MIISAEQVRLAVEYLRTPSGDEPATHNETLAPAVSPELLERVHELLDSCPDTREDRMEHGRACMKGVQPTGSQVAEKMIGRIISDSLR